MSKKTKGNLSKAMRETKAFKEWKNELTKSKQNGNKSKLGA